MARKPRIEVAGGIHHVWARGNRKQVIYRDEIDRQRYLEELAAAVIRCRWRLLAYCLMTNHVHLVVETPESNLGRGMQRVHGRYGLWFNARHQLVGHLFQGRYQSELVKDDAQLIALIGYVVANPVEAGICRHPDEWPWGSHAAAPPWVDRPRLLELIGGWTRDPVRAYREIVDQRVERYFGGSEAA